MEKKSYSNSLRNFNDFRMSSVCLATSNYTDCLKECQFLKLLKWITPVSQYDMASQNLQRVGSHVTTPFYLYITFL